MIGEAAARLPADFRLLHPDVPWSDIIAFRNFAVHEYFAVSCDIVWATATGDVPHLRRYAVRLLDALDEKSPTGGDLP